MSNTKKMVLAGLFTALTAIGAFIKIPLPYVPIVLQGLFVFLSGISLGSKWGMISQLVYVIVGLAGLPVFTSGSGIGYILHPTFGYLLGFIASAYVTGLIIEKCERHDFKTALLACLSGMAVTYAIGVPYLILILKLIVKMESAYLYAIWTGLVVTLPGDIIKAAVASLITQKLPSSLF